VQSWLATRGDGHYWGQAPLRFSKVV